MSNSNSIPTNMRNFIDTDLQLNDNSKKAINRLWRLYLRIYQHDTEQAEGELQNFLQELHYSPERSQETMLHTINQKINDVQREEGIIDHSAMGRKSFKRKRSSKRRSLKRKRSSKRRRTK